LVDPFSWHIFLLRLYQLYYMETLYHLLLAYYAPVTTI
jgi:hypothetical protein